MDDLLRMTFGDLGSLFDGPHATPTRRAEGPFFLNISSLKAGRLDLAESDHVSEEDFVRWTKRVTPQPNDLLFSYETRIGEAALMPEGVRACLGRRMALLRPNPNIIDARFLLYFYLSPEFQQTIAQNTIHGATVPRIGLATMPSWPVAIPQLSQQRAIAEVLGALDDKIAANRTVGRTALALADAIFAALVADIRFGDISFEDVANIGGGGTPKTAIAEYWDGTIKWATPTDVTALDVPYLRETKRLITSDGLSACSSVLYPKESILMTSRATVGAFAVAKAEIAVNQGFIVVNARDSSLQWWLFHEMRSRVPEFISHANGATFLELSRGRFKKLPVRMPDISTARNFSETVGPLHAVAAQSDAESRILARTRDELLPLLMSGKLRVKDAEKKVEAIV